MKRFLPVLGVLATVLAFAALVQTFGFERTAALEWKALPGGGEIAFYDVTVGTTHGMEFPRKRLSQRLHDVLKRRSLKPLWEKPGRCELGTSLTPLFAVWFIFRDADSFPFAEGASQLILPDGQIYSSYYSGGGGGRSGLTHTHFEVVPYTTEKLVLTTTIKGQRFKWDLPNPTYNPAHTAGDASGLPRTQRVNGYDITLQNVELSYSEHPPTNWQAKPVITVSRDGKDVSKWFDVNSINHDLGLLSAPVWRIEVTMSRATAYQFSADEVEWLGSYSKSRLAALKPAEFEQFPIKETARTRGVFIAGLFGAGQYEFKKMRVANSRELPGLPPSHRPSTFQPEPGTVVVTLARPSLIIASAYSAVPVFRTEGDEQVLVEWEGSLDSSYSVKFYGSAPSEALRVGVADRKDPATDGRPVTFLVRPPRIPAGVDPRTGQQVASHKVP